jgi:HAD superfamily hydrolase (TIGR01509 family)
VAALRALVFDFDGLILDTETPEFRAWQEVFAAHGAVLEAVDWTHVIGSTDSGWDPATEIERQTGARADRVALREAWTVRRVELLALESVRPGVVELVKEAARRDLGLAVASSASRSWVEGHLIRLGLRDAFSVIATGDEVPHSKPDPAVYRLAVARLGVPAAAALALEDSPNGVRAALAAGLRCIAVPNEVSRQLDLSAADAVLGSLAELDLDRLPCGRDRPPSRGCDA